MSSKKASVALAASRSDGKGRSEAESRRSHRKRSARLSDILKPETTAKDRQLMRISDADRNEADEESEDSVESDSSDITSGSSDSSDDDEHESDMVDDVDEEDRFDGFEEEVNGAAEQLAHDAGIPSIAKAGKLLAPYNDISQVGATEAGANGWMRQTNGNAPTAKDDLQQAQVLVEKDEEEAELEALIFGDSVGFRDSIRQLSKQGRDQQRQQQLRQQGLNDADDIMDESDPEALEDDDLFFVDAQGTSGVSLQMHDGGAQGKAAAVDEQQSTDEEEKPAWEDSDDARIRVSLAQVPRLRKLRFTEDEDVVSGKEYIRRLRRQYLKLNPRPQWVADAVDLQRRRKRRRTENGEDATDSSDSNLDMQDVDTITGHRSLSDLLRDANSLTRPGHSLAKRKFKPEVIDIQRTKHIADKGPSAITTLQVHPQLPLLIASGPSSKMDLYHLHDNAPNYTTHLTSLWMRHHPFTTTLFHPLHTDPRIFLSARRRYFHVWNLTTGQLETVTRMYGHAQEQRSMESFKIDPTGNYIAFIGSTRKGGGVLNFLDANSLQWIAQARIEGRGGIADFAWWRNGTGVVVAGKNGEVTEWSLKQRRIVAQWRDEGAVGTTALALGGKSKHTKSIGGDAYIAIGSSAGIVNVYSRAQWFTDAAADISSNGSLTAQDDHMIEDGAENDQKPSEDVDHNNGIPSHPKPLRALDQLTTPISHLTFTPNGQVLCMASRWKKDALRLVHLPSCTVYRNWPTSTTPLGRISAVCWGEIAVGDAAGSDKPAATATSVLKLVVGNEAGRISAWDVRGD